MTSNDFDDLFKRAAEQYPLRTDNGDWDKVERALNEKDDDAGFAEPVFESAAPGRRRLLLLLLLLPLMGIGYYVYKTRSATGKLQSQQTVQPAGRNGAGISSPDATKGKGSLSKPETLQKPGENIPVAGATVNKKIAVENNATHLAQANGITKSKPAATGYADGIASHSGTQQVNRNGVDIMATTPAGRNKQGKKILSGAANTYSSSVAGNERQDTKGFDGSNTKSGLASVNENSQTGRSANHTFDIINPDRQDGFHIPSVTQDVLANACSVSIKPDADPAAVAKSKSARDKKRRERSFYAGIIWAPDLSSVKFQKINGAGNTAGIVAGYNFSARFALETGVYLDTKKYYSEGEYFDKKNVPLLNYTNVNLQNVQGSCRMIEVPVNLRYDIHSGKKNKWFATTGLSTYFMFNESYNYKYTYNGNAMERSYDYNRSSQNWFSIVNLSAGYEHRLGTIGSLRIEPYLKIPLAGMGTGSLPITSAGLNVGIVRQIK